MSYSFEESFRAGPSSGKLLRLVGFIVKKFVTMHSHMNLKHFRYSKCKHCFNNIQKFKIRGEQVSEGANKIAV
jgi:hypothetical protein